MTVPLFNGVVVVGVVVADVVVVVGAAALLLLMVMVIVMVVVVIRKPMTEPAHMREIGLRGINCDALMLLGGILLWRTASIPRVLMKRAEFFLRPSIVEKERRTPSQLVARGMYNRARWTCHQVELEFR